MVQPTKINISNFQLIDRGSFVRIAQLVSNASWCTVMRLKQGVSFSCSKWLIPSHYILRLFLAALIHPNTSNNPISFGLMAFACVGICTTKFTLTALSKCLGSPMAGISMLHMPGSRAGLASYPDCILFASTTDTTKSLFIKTTYVRRTPTTGIQYFGRSKFPRSGCPRNGMRMLRNVPIIRIRLAVKIVCAGW